MKILGDIFFVILIGMAAMFFMKGGCGAKKNVVHKAEERGATKEVASIADIAAHQFDSTRYYKDMYDNEHAIKELALGDAAAVRVVYKKKEDSLCKVMHLRNNQIKDMVDVVSRVQGTFTAKVDNIPTFDVAEDLSPDPSPKAR